jgi:hypothetical protein
MRLPDTQTFRVSLHRKLGSCTCRVRTCRTCCGMQALAKFGVTDDVTDLLKAADQNGDGQIDYQEFVFLMRETNKELSSKGEAGGLLRGIRM